MLALELHAIEKVYRGDVHAVKNLHLQVESGDFFALLGANGAGKSTTLGMIAGLVKKTSGQLKIAGFDIDTHPSEARLRLGVVPQEVNLNIFETCFQTLVNQAGYFGIPRKQAGSRAEALLDALQLGDKIHTITRNLSGGMKRRLMIARALVHHPDILMLDEPTAGVDIEIRRMVWDFLEKRNASGTTILLTTHYLEEAEQLCKHVGVLRKGQLVESSSVHDMIKSLPKQVLLLQLASPPATDFLDAPFTATLVDSHTLEIHLPAEATLNGLFQYCESKQLTILGMRQKTNRLEQKFMDYIENA